MDAWWPKLVARRVPAGARQGRLRRSCRAMLPDRRPHGGRAPTRRLLRRLVRLRARRTCATSSAPRVRGAWSRAYCGGGSQGVPRGALRDRLRAALKVTPQSCTATATARATPARPAAIATARPSPRASTSAGAVPEPADLPADGLALPRRPLDLGWPAGRGLYAAPRQGSQRSKGEVLEFQQSSLRRGRFHRCRPRASPAPLSCLRRDPAAVRHPRRGRLSQRASSRRGRARQRLQLAQFERRAPRRRTSPTSSRSTRTWSTAADADRRADRRSTSRTRPSASARQRRIDDRTEPGVTISATSAYGVPHIYGDTRADTMFGAGYAGAEDRLFLMDVLRHTGRAELSSFLGGSNGDRRDAPSGPSPPTPKPTSRSRSTRRRSSTAQRGSRRSKTCSRLRRRHQRLHRRRQRSTRD